MCSLAFVMDTAGELALHGQLRRYPPAVMQTLWVCFFLWSDGADMVCVGYLTSIGYLRFLDEFYCSRSIYFSFSGLDFPTPFGMRLTHLFAFALSQRYLSGTFRSLSRDVCLPASGGVTSADM